MGAPLTVGYGEGRKLPRLGRAGAGAADPAHRLSRGRRLGGRRGATRSRSSTATTSRSSARSSSPARRPRGSTRATTPISCARRFSSSRSSSPRRCRAMSGRSRARSRCPTGDLDLAAINRLTIVACGTSLLRRAGRQILGRAIRPRAGRHRCRERVPLPPAGARAGRAGAVHQPVGRDRRHARRAAPRARRAAADRGRGQRPDQLDGARGGPAAADPCRARDRGRLDQGVHLPAGGAGGAGGQSGAGQGPTVARRGAGDRRAICRRRRRRSTRRSATTRISPRWRI